MSDNAVGARDAKQTTEMQVANIGFLIDRMGKDAHPLQFLRELTQNSIEAILATSEERGEVVWDVDWVSYTLGEKVKLACIDTGTGMTGPEMVRYINQLSISTREQAHDKNFGIGAKIAALTRNHEGLVYLSWKDGVGSMIHVWRDPETQQYGIRRQERPDGTLAEWSSPISEDVKPEQIGEHGTMVVLLGNSADEETMEPPEGTPSPSVWIARYLNTRYYQFPEGITVRARQGWKEPRTNTDVNLLRGVTGQRAYLQQHCSSAGTVALTNAVAQWWILKDEPALTQNSGYIASSGHVAALYQDELYEMTTGRSGVARLQLFGVIFGHQRVVIYLEPLIDERDSGSLTPNAARTHLLLNEQILPWSDWAAEFREPSRFPTEIKQLMEEVTAGKDASDHKQAIKDRLKQIRDLLNVSRYRPVSRGSLSVAGEAPGGKSKENGSTPSDSLGRGGGRGGRAGGVYALFIDDDGDPGEEIIPELDPDVLWISVLDGTRTQLLLEDRAAKYLPDQNLLQINADFRVFMDMIGRWESRYANVPGAPDVIRDGVREWFEQALVETILGAQALKNSPQWAMDDIARLWSEEALTAVVLQRYHIDVALRRAFGSKLGSIKESAVA